MAEQQKNPKAVPALVMGIIAFVVPVIGFITGILGIIFGAKGLKISKEQNGEGHGMSIVGLVLSIVGLVGQFVIMLFVIIGIIAYAGVYDMSSVSMEKTTFGSPFIGTEHIVLPNSQGGVDISVPLTNGYSEPVTISTSDAQGMGDCLSVSKLKIEGSNEVPAGEYFMLTWTCLTDAESGDSFNADLSFTYETSTGLMRTHTGSIYGTVG